MARSCLAEQRSNRFLESDGSDCNRSEDDFGGGEDLLHVVIKFGV